MATTATVTQCLKVAALHRRTVCLVGSPGVGKTSLVKLVCEALKINLVIYHPVIGSPTDLMGYGFDAGDHAEHKAYDVFWQVMNAKGPTVFFIDDFGQATQTMQNACTQLMWGRKLCGKVIPDYVMVWIATNRKEDFAGANPLLETVKGRQAWILEVTPSLDAWVNDFAGPKGIHPHVIAYNRWMERRGEPCLNVFKPSRDMDCSPTSRNWETVSDALFDGYPDEALPEIVQSRIGKHYGTEFCAFHKTIDRMISLETIVADPKGAPLPKSTELDVTYAVISGLAGIADKKNLGAVLTYGARLPKDFARLLVVDILAKDKKLAATKEFIMFAANNSDIYKV